MISERVQRLICSEDISLIENYELALNAKELWVCHHRLELRATGGITDCSSQDLRDWGLYYHRPASELIFLSRRDHSKLHSGVINNYKPGSNKGHTFTQEQRNRLSNSLLEYYKSIDEDYQKDRIKKVRPIYNRRAQKISNTMSERRAVYVQFDTNTPWGRLLTTKQIANLNGSKASGKVKQYIDKYGYVNILHTRYYCKIIQTDRICLI